MPNIDILAGDEKIGTEALLVESPIWGDPNITFVMAGGGSLLNNKDLVIGTGGVVFKESVSFFSVLLIGNTLIAGKELVAATSSLVSDALVVVKLNKFAEDTTVTDVVVAEIICGTNELLIVAVVVIVGFKTSFVVGTEENKLVMAVGA